ncbi:MAG: outer membrane beta-barrel domain-containing protein [Polyangiaceae bacterium]|nr:outer membrane beta-barrel domain-containing protein [Polyangiaceae bacterium]
MNQGRMGLLVAAALLAVPATASAQKPGKGAKPPAGATDKPADKADEKKPEDKPAGGADAKPADAPAADAPAADAPKGEDPSAGGICDLDPSQCPQVDFDAAASKPIPAQMYAVQQLYALRVRRVEVNPYWSFSLNDQFVSHPAPGMAINYYVTNVLAVGVNGTWYRPFGSNLNQDSAFNAQTRRAARVGVPLTEYDWSAALNFTYVPVYGKFAGFGDFIFHYDAYIVGGLGMLSNRPIAVIDPDNRTFDSKAHLAFNAGLGLRIFFNRWFAAVGEVRNYVFQDQLEATTIARDKAATDKATWYGDKPITVNVQAQVGLAIFLPFSWEYRLPK